MIVVSQAGEQHEVVRREFSRQAASFEAAGSLFRDSAILDWIATHVPIAPGARILDVAGGTGQLGRHLAREGATAVIVDLTDAMLATGLRSVLDEDRGGVVFVRGNAAALPFPADQFDVVVCRFALHHIQRAAAAIAEMARVCRPGGVVAVIDMLAGGEHHDEFERLRDPSHVRALTEKDITSAMRASGHPPSVVVKRDHTMPVGPWLDQAQTATAARETIRQALSEETRGAQPTGLHASHADGELTITHRWLLARS
jgi:ubiquinone/menaquinone biosynthesis C-methylase UbiE